MTMPPLASGPIDQGNQDSAADQISKLIAGNPDLVTHPHLVSALYNAQATPEQAQTINVFVGGLQAKGRVQAAQAAGAKITLSSQEKAGLSALGVDYSPVEFTQADANAQIASQLAALGKQDKPKKSGGGGWSFGRVFHDVTHNPITDAIGKGANAVQSATAEGASNVVHGFESLGGGSGGGSNVATSNGAMDVSTANQQVISDAHDRAARAAGYDPSSPLSMIAYGASGKSTLDLSALYSNNDPDLVDEAIKFTDDPQAYLKNIADPTSGLTPEQAGAKLQELQGPQFQKLVTQVNARKATIGNVVTEGIDPLKHPELHDITSKSIDVVSSFVLDPTLAALGAVKAVKMSQLALDGSSVFSDGLKVRAILSGEQKGLYASQVRRGMSSFLDSTAQIRKGIAEGDAEATAAGYAKLRAETPGLEHLAPDFLGGSRAVAADGDMSTGALKFESTDPITTMDEAADYLSSTVGLVRLRAGRPLVESSLMPGQLSAFGYKKLHGSLAAVGAARGVRRDSKLLIDLNKAGVAGRVLPSEEDAVDVATGKIINNPDVPQLDDVTSAAAGLPSAARAASATQFGDALQSVRSGFGPTAIAARSRLLAQRLTSFLPRNTSFVTDDPNAVQNVFRYGKMYLTNGRANLLAATYAAGDEGARKAILNGMEMQTLHAAGLGKTVAGRAMLEDASRSLSDERYASTGNLDRFVDPNTGEDRAAALWDTQVNPKITLTGFSDIQKVSAKIGIWESTIGRGLNSQMVDNLMGIIKPGWLITGTNVVRNSGEDLVGAALRGEYGDVTRAKSIAEMNGLLPNRTRLGSVVAAPLARVAQRYRMLKVSTADESLGLHYIADSFTPDEMHALADGFARQHASSMIDPSGARQADEITKAGLVPRAMKTRRTGFGNTSVDEDIIGADRLSTALGRVVNGNADHATVVLDHLTDPDSTPIESVVRSLQRPENAKRVGQMIRSRLYRDDTGAMVKAVAPDEKELALRQLAGDQAQDLKYLVQGRNGEMNDDLVNYIRENGKAPDSKWIMDHLTGEQRPVTVLAPQFEAMPLEGGVTGFVGAISDLAGQGYKHLVERSINRISTMPIFLSHYGKARFELRAVEDAMVDGGLTTEAAAHNAKQLAMDMAWNRTLKYIDDPGLRTQMDIVGRNFFAFSRATQAFVRRWGTQFVEDPARLRKAMLTLEGAQHTGVTYTDENGDKQFIFPGSGLAINALQHVESLLPGVNLLSVPGITPDLTGKVALLQPGLQNPLQMSLTPMINVPMRTVFQLFPEHRQFLDEVDTFLNGRNGEGQSPLAELLPTSVKKFTDALNADDRDSMMASATRQAILNLAAAGKTPPAGADSAQIDDWLQNLKTQVRNQLIHRAIFGFFTPAPPGQPSEATDGSKADWFYGATGIHGLDSEYKKLLNDAGGDPIRASAIWAELHPDKPFYSVGTTQSTTKSATVVATRESEGWIESNLGFMKKYKGVSAYFIPKATQTGDFDIAAYNSQLELGLRQHKSLSDFYTDVRIKNAQDTYFTALDARDAAIQKDPSNATTYKNRFDVWNKEFKSLNPLFAGQLNSFSSQVTTAQDQLSTLRRLVKDNPSVPGVDVVKQMVGAYDTYHNALAAHPGDTTQAKVIHKSLASQYSEWMKATVAESPQFAALYQGVFRTLDTKTLDSLEN